MSVQLMLTRAVLLDVCAADVKKGCSAVCLCSWCWKGLSCCMSVQLMLKRAVVCHVQRCWRGLFCCVSVQLMLKRAVVCHVQLMLKRAVLLCVCAVDVLGYWENLPVLWRVGVTTTFQVMTCKEYSHLNFVLFMMTHLFGRQGEWCHHFTTLPLGGHNSLMFFSVSRQN